MKAEDGIWLNLKTENPSVALKRPDLFTYSLHIMWIMDSTDLNLFLDDRGFSITGFVSRFV